MNEQEKCVPFSFHQLTSRADGTDRRVSLNRISRIVWGSLCRRKVPAPASELAMLSFLAERYSYIVLFSFHYSVRTGTTAPLLC